MPQSAEASRRPPAAFAPNPCPSRRSRWRRSPSEVPSTSRCRTFTCCRHSGTSASSVARRSCMRVSCLLRDTDLRFAAQLHVRACRTSQGALARLMNAWFGMSRSCARSVRSRSRCRAPQTVRGSSRFCNDVGCLCHRLASMQALAF